MSRLSWDDIGDKLFEGGVDRGVLYPENSTGVAWNGLVNVIEKPTLSTSTSYYQDGQKYLDKKGSEEFAGSIEAFTFPDEFAECDGTWSTEYGFELTQQTRKPFNLCYRTGIGNDIAGLDHGYKLHLIYDAVASPSNKAFPTLSSNIDVRPFLWEFTTTPTQTLLGYKPTAHIILNSLKIAPEIMALVESYLYGSDALPPTLLSIDDLIQKITEGLTLQIIDNQDGSWTAIGGSSEISFLSSTEFQISSPTLTTFGDGTFAVKSIND